MVRQCHSSQLAIQRLIAEAADDDTVLFEALAVHDELEKVLAKHADMAPSRPQGTPTPTLFRSGGHSHHGFVFDFCV